MMPRVGLRKNFQAIPMPLRTGIRRVRSWLPSRFRYHPAFQRTYAMLKESQWWDEHTIAIHQFRELKSLLQEAAARVPYYGRLFAASGFDPDRFRGPSDLGKIPFLTKEIVRTRRMEFLARGIEGSALDVVTTGGSTAEPLGFFKKSREYDAKEWAFNLVQLERIGFDQRCRSVILRGERIRVTRNRFEQYDPLRRNLLLSSFHLSEENMPAYIDRIRSFSPDYIQAYPSVITQLARYHRENDLPGYSRLKGIICGSEPLYPWQRKLLTDTFRCRVFCIYGQTEQAALAGECEHGTLYHVFPEYGYLELVDDEGQSIVTPGRTGEIVATGFINRIFPFIRYRTGDLATLAEGPCPCGRKYPLLAHIVGRQQEFIFNRRNEAISLGPVLFGIHDADMSCIRQIQFFQNRPGNLILRVIKSPGASNESVEAYIARSLRTRLGDQFDIRVDFVQRLPGTARGKHRFLEQAISPPPGDPA